MQVRLGRKALKTDTRTLRLARYFMAGIAPPPPTRDWTKGVTDWGVMLNDQLGDCTIAGAGHAVQVFSLNASGTMFTVPDDQIQQCYEAWDGYNPADPSTDQGGVELDVLTKWKKSTFFGHVLDGFADVEPLHTVNVKQAINLFGGLYIGMDVPNFIMENIPDVWQMPPTGTDLSIDGGHCVFVVGYDADTLTFISWGKLYKMTWDYWAKFVDEAHTLISSDFINSASGVDPSGLNLVALQNDLAQIN